MTTHGDGPSRGGPVRWLLLAALVLVAVGGLGVAWVASQPATERSCVGGGAIDERGATDPEAARTRWLASAGLDVDIDRPDRVDGSGDLVTARYRVDSPAPDRSGREEVAFREVVTQRGEDGRWRVVEASRCTERTT